MLRGPVDRARGTSVVTPMTRLHRRRELTAGSLSSCPVGRHNPGRAGAAVGARGLLDGAVDAELAGQDLQWQAGAGRGAQRVVEGDGTVAGSGVGNRAAATTTQGHARARRTSRTVDPATGTPGGPGQQTCRGAGRGAAPLRGRSGAATVPAPGQR
ncbi:hypothetical protein GCM10009767_00390 [Kocuria aegyptia]|uniref:Uncharacterized protein n=1 Tax=Kocuria aegyptia TaxID=330943 RepID=A0ABN2K180_9MICC